MTLVSENKYQQDLYYELKCKYNNIHVTNNSII